MTRDTTIAELPHYIVMDRQQGEAMASEAPTTYQSEAELESELIGNLQSQGYEFLPDVRTPEALLANARRQIEALNGLRMTDAEWGRFVSHDLDKAGAGQKEKSKAVHGDVFSEFVTDDGEHYNIRIVDKRDLSRNRLQVIRQFEQTGSQANRYDVSILVNGLPMVHVELKRRGVAIREAFNQVHRYSKESFNSESSLYKYVQMFVISNGTDTRYFANTTGRDRNSFDFTMNWARSDNSLIRDLSEFTGTFFERSTLLQVLFRYSILDTNDALLIMRPYQIAATERILWKIRSTHMSKLWSRPEGGGYVWHTTGSGKTLTSFKAAQLASELDFVDKVLFVVDRRDLYKQTEEEYKRFSEESVTGSDSTAGLKSNLESADRRIVVTTIQKLNNLMRSEAALGVYSRHVVFIFDECHRSQFGEAQRNLRKHFKHYCQFGFTGTPIFAENALGDATTESVFGRMLHSYVITDALRDGKVLKFKVDYNDVRPRFRQAEAERDETRAAATRKMLLHPDRIGEICRYVVDNFRLKTHRATGARGFNAMMAVDSVDAAKLYYQELRRLQAGSPHPLRIATIFSYAANEPQRAAGEIADEGFDPDALDMSAKEFLTSAMADYNAAFGTSHSVDSKGFYKYYKELGKRVRDGEVDLLIVVGMFLTGFDAPKLNTLFVDKNLRYHGLLQAFSRTNRIYDSTKTFGNIVTFRDLEENTEESLRLFGREDAGGGSAMVLERKFDDYMHGYVDASGRRHRGYAEVVSELLGRFPTPDVLGGEAAKKEFVGLFGECLRLDNILWNYDEFTIVRALRDIAPDDAAARKSLRLSYGVSEAEMRALGTVELLSDRAMQDYRSTYNDIREWLKDRRGGEKPEKPLVDWDDVVFEVELLKQQEIDLDYILALLYERSRAAADKAAMADEARRMIRSSVSHRGKEGLIVDFIDATDLASIADRAGVVEAFYTYARARMRAEAEAIISEEGLNADAARRYMRTSLLQECASANGTGLRKALPRMSPMNPKYIPMKKRVLERMEKFVEKYKGVGQLGN